MQFQNISIHIATNGQSLKRINGQTALKQYAPLTSLKLLGGGGGAGGGGAVGDVVSITKPQTKKAA